MKHEDLIDTIQRLLALTASPNQHEAEAAMAKAQELMLKHNLSVETVEATELHKTTYREDEVWEGSKRRPYEQSAVLDVLLDFFFVKCLYSWRQGADGSWRYTLTIFGTPENVTVGKYLYVYLSRVYRDLWKKARRDCLYSRRDARGFFNGLSDGLRERLSGERDAQVATTQSLNALVVVTDAVAQAFDVTHPGTAPKRETPIKSNDAWYNGYVEGKHIDIRQALGVNRQLAIEHV